MRCVVVPRVTGLNTFSSLSLLEVVGALRYTLTHDFSLATLNVATSITVTIVPTENSFVDLVTETFEACASQNESSRIHERFGLTPSPPPPSFSHRRTWTMPATRNYRSPLR